MQIDRLLLEGFRNYDSQQLTFDGSCNVIYGENAQGKTNLLEAIVYLSCGRSPRTHADRELIGFGTDRARLVGQIRSREREFETEIQLTRGRRRRMTVNGVAARNGGASPVEIETRSWFNPNLITRWFIVPGLIAVLALINSILSGALSIAREREEGTFDQLLVAPYNPGEILLGKGIATVITGSMQAVFVVLVAMFWFRIPFQGSIWLLATAILLFIITATAIGLCISSFAQSLQQAIVGTFLLLVPMVMLSGFATPISSMPDIFQDLTLLNPMRYGLELIQRIFLEGAGFLDLWPLFGAILIVTAVSVFAAIFSFHHKIS